MDNYRMKLSVQYGQSESGSWFVENVINGELTRSWFSDSPSAYEYALRLVHGDASLVTKVDSGKKHDSGRLKQLRYLERYKFRIRARITMGGTYTPLFGMDDHDDVVRRSFFVEYSAAVIKAIAIIEVHELGFQITTPMKRAVARAYAYSDLWADYGGSYDGNKPLVDSYFENDVSSKVEWDKFPRNYPYFL